MSANAQNSTSSNTGQNQTSTSEESQTSSNDPQTQNSTSSDTSDDNNDESASSNSEQESGDSALDNSGTIEEQADQNVTSTETTEPAPSTNSTSYDSAPSNSSNSTAESSNQNSTSNGDENLTPQNTTSIEGSSANYTNTSIDDVYAQNVTASIPTENATATLTIENNRAPAPVTISGEPLVAANSSITRSITYPTMLFEGEVVEEMTVTVEWNTDGTSTVSDSAGYRYSLSIPLSDGEQFLLLSNSTHIDQKVVSTKMQYDIYWTAVKNPETRFFDKYKFTIAGSSLEASDIALKVDAGKYFNVLGSELQIIRSQNNSETGSTTEPLDPSLDWNPSSTFLDNDQTDDLTGTDLESSDSEIGIVDSSGLKLDWADAIRSNQEVIFDSANSILKMPVAANSSFLIDPEIVSTSAGALSPDSLSTFEGEKRIVTTANETMERINVFFSTGNGLVYRTSDDEGETWSSSKSISTGSIASDSNRWSMTTSHNYDTDYIHLFYWNVSGTNTKFYTVRGAVSGLDIVWGSAIQLGSASINNATCGAGSCAAVVTSVDTEGAIYAAFRWLPANATTYSYVIKKSADAGQNWADSLAQVDGVSSSRFTMTLTPLESEKMLFAYAKSGRSELFYRVFNSTIWGQTQNITSTGMTVGPSKQISSVSDEFGTAYVAYTNVTNTLGGILKVATFDSNGTFVGMETADTTLRHRLPSIIYSSDGDFNINSIVDDKIYDTRKSLGAWQVPFQPYGSTFNLPDRLTATNIMHDENAALWREGTTSPFNLMFAMAEHGVVIAENNAQLSPGISDYYEGERRVAINANGTLFAFYYDGSNIVYKMSFDEGHTWTGTATSAGTGTLATDNFRWTIAQTTYNATDRITLLYFTVSGSNTTFWQKTFKAYDSGLVLVSTISSFSAVNDASCSTGVCAAAAGSSDSNSTLFAAYRWKSGGQWYAKILNSADGGASWTSSLNLLTFNTSNPVTITLTKLDSGKMIFAWAKYESGHIWYRVYNGSKWQSFSSVSGTMSQNSIKQLSSATIIPSNTNFTTVAYVAFLSGGNTGSLKVLRFYGNGTYIGTETADSSYSHKQPSISTTEADMVHLYSIVGDVIYDTIRNETAWQSPVAPYGYDFYSPDQLTSPLSSVYNSGVIYRSGYASPYSIKFSGKLVGIVEEYNAYDLSPKKSDFYEGERRVIRTSGVEYAFYFDGRNIVYEYTVDNGQTWRKDVVNSLNKVGQYYRWTLTTTKSGTTNYVMLLYYTVETGSMPVKFYAQRGQILTGGSISWSTASLLYSVTKAPDYSLCGSTACASVVAAADTSGNIYAALGWLNASSPHYEYMYQIRKYTISNNQWVSSPSLDTQLTGSRKPVVMGLTNLADGDMLFAYATYESKAIEFRQMSGNNWDYGAGTIRGEGWEINTRKQFSMASDDDNRAYLAFVNRGNYGALKVVNWTADGSLLDVTTLDPRKIHSLPSISKGEDNIMAIYTVADYKVRVTLKVHDKWLKPVLPYGAGNMDQLTSGISIGNGYLATIGKTGQDRETVKANGFIPAVIALLCEHIAAPTVSGRCTDSQDTFYYETPWMDQNGDISYNTFTCEAGICANAGYYIKYPRHIDNVYFLVYGPYTLNFKDGTHVGYGFDLFLDHTSFDRWTEYYPAVLWTELAVPTEEFIVYENLLMYSNGIITEGVLFETDIALGYSPVE